MLGHVTPTANGQLYTIKINKDLLMRLLKRGDLYWNYTAIPGQMRLGARKAHAKKDIVPGLKSISQGENIVFNE